MVTALLAGSYPAFYISKFQPASILNGKQKLGGTGWFSMILLILQFGISLIGIICSIAFVQNAKYQDGIDTGFDQKGVVFTFVHNGLAYEALRNELIKSPEILSIAGSAHNINSQFSEGTLKYVDKEIESDILDVGENYIKTIGLTLIDGRDFHDNSETDRKESIVVTKAFATKMGWEKAIGKQVLWHDTVSLYVVGLLKDIYIRGLWKKTRPMMIRYVSKGNYKHLSVRSHPDKIAEVNKLMQTKWKQLFPNRIYSSTFMDQDATESALITNNMVKMFTFLGSLALLLSTAGLFSMVSLNIIKRLKEIGVRKVLGATTGNIARIINSRFIILLSIASFVGCLLGFFMINTFMDSIWDYFQSATITTLLISVLIMFSVSSCTIGFKTYKAASANPVKSLRDE